MQCHDNMLILSVSHKKNLPNIYSVHIGWHNTLIFMVNSNNTTYETWLAYLQKTQQIYMTYITTYPPSDVHAFNDVRTTLHTLQKRIHILRKRPQDIPWSPCLRCTIVTSRTTDMQPLPHDRDCRQANLILRGRVQNSHHPTGWYLHSNHVVGASLQNSKLHKVNAESKSLLTCHLLRLL
jgi:hypothetical protein